MYIVVIRSLKSDQNILITKKFCLHNSTWAKFFTMYWGIFQSKLKNLSLTLKQWSNFLVISEFLSAKLLNLLGSMVLIKLLNFKLFKYGRNNMKSGNSHYVIFSLSVSVIPVDVIKIIKIRYMKQRIEYYTIKIQEHEDE